MEQLKRWIDKNMVLVHFGDYMGLKDLSAEQLKELSKYVEEAKKIRPVVVNRDIKDRRE